MANIVSYAETVLDSFRTLPFHSVDSLVLSWLSNLRFPPEVHEVRGWTGIPLRDLFRAELFPTLFQGLWDPDSTRALFTALAASPRFRDMKLMGYTCRADQTLEMQFTALTFQLRPDLHYVAFGGTDTTLVGWKENFNMAYLSPVPAQREAVRYLTLAADRCPGDLLVGGHSKGGNLAVYGAAAADSTLQARIRRVYSHDGPGFPPQFLETPGCHAIRPRIEKTIPQASVVGLLLDQAENYRVVQSTGFSLLQHDPFSWVVREGAFLYDTLTNDARFWDETLDQWLGQLTPAERERFVESLYDILSSLDLRDFAQFRDGWQKNLPALLKAAGNLDPDTRSFLFQVTRELISISLRNVPDLYRDQRRPGFFPPTL